MILPVDVGPLGEQRHDLGHVAGVRSIEELLVLHGGKFMPRGRGWGSEGWDQVRGKEERIEILQSV